MTRDIRRIVHRLAGAVAIGTALLVPATALAEPVAVTAPSLSGIPALPGPIVGVGTPSEDITTLKVAPDVAPAGSTITVTAAGLPASSQVSLVWMTAGVRYVLDPKVDSVDYIGRKVDKFGTELAVTRTDPKGNLLLKLKVPTDFGGMHDLYAVVDGKQVARGGFLLERVMKISPSSGPVGTLITVSVVGMGHPTYESVGGVLWDNRYAGAIAANTTRGVAKFTIRAAGKPGTHWLELGGSSHTVPYLNMRQSPVPWTDGHRAKFTITKDAGAPPVSWEWPEAVKRTTSNLTTLGQGNFAAGSTATATLASESGVVLSKTTIAAKGLTPGAPVDVVWQSVVGNRVNCTGQCWNFVGQPLGRGTALADGSVSIPLTVPDGLGGWHAVQLVQGGKVMAQAPYFVKRSFVSAPKVVKQGQPFTVTLKGVGWTQLDNTVGVTYDNAYIGYACGFNSNGHVEIQLFATGEPGTHLIDIYPLLYTQQPAYPYSQLGMVPLLSFAKDAPGLALGYQLPATRLAIQVVE